jgi:hypothetical protein
MPLHGCSRTSDRGHDADVVVDQAAARMAFSSRRGIMPPGVSDHHLDLAVLDHDRRVFGRPSEVLATCCTFDAARRQQLRRAACGANA